MRKFRLLFLLSIACNNYIHANKSKDTTAIILNLESAEKLQHLHPDSAYRLASNAFINSQKIDFKSGIATAFMRLGSIQYIRGNNDSALAYLLKSLLLRKELRQYGRASGTCNLLSYVYTALGKKDSAFSYLYQALRLDQFSQDHDNMAYTCSTIGNLALDYGDSVQALKYYRQAEIYSKNSKNLQVLSVTAGGMGNYYFKQKKWNEALAYFIKKEGIDLRNNDPVQQASSLSNIALCYESLNEFRKSSYYYHAALHIYISEHMKSDEALIYFNLGSLFINNQHPDSALHYLIQAAKIARTIDDIALLAKSHEYMSDAYALKGDYLNAYQEHLLYTSINDSLINIEKINSISEMQTKYETEKKEQEITILDAQSKSRTAQRNFLIAGCTVLLLTLFILAFYYIQRRKLALKNEQLAQQEISTLIKEQEIKSYNAMIEGQEEERQRIASDLHDRLGSMLSTIKLLFGSLEDKLDKQHHQNTQQYTKANELIDEACVEVRRISHNLSTGMIMNFGMVAALNELCESIDNSGIIKCKLMVYGMNERLEQQVEIGVYRILQELFNNILKHAKASQIIVQLNQQLDILTITMEDNGIGFDVTEKKKTGGMGLKNLEARTQKLHGHFHIDSSPGRGTTTIIEIPITPQSHD